VGPMRELEWDSGKHLTFFFSRLFCLFVCGAALQRNSITYIALCSVAP
jgi:hypothetical protein